MVIVSPFLEFHQLEKKDQNNRALEQVTKRWNNVCLQQQQQQLYFLTLNIQISHHLQIARLIEAGGVWTA